MMSDNQQDGADSAQPLSEQEEQEFRRKWGPRLRWDRPSDVQRLLDTIDRERTERRRLEDELERLTQFTAGCVAVGGKQITELEELRAIVGLADDYVTAGEPQYVGTSERARCYEALWGAIRKYRQPKAPTE